MNINKKYDSHEVWKVLYTINIKKEIIVTIAFTIMTIFACYIYEQYIVYDELDRYYVKFLLTIGPALIVNLILVVCLFMQLTKNMYIKLSKNILEIKKLQKYNIDICNIDLIEIKNKGNKEEVNFKFKLIDKRGRKNGRKVTFPTRWFSSKELYDLINILISMNNNIRFIKLESSL